MLIPLLKKLHIASNESEILHMNWHEIFGTTMLGGNGYGLPYNIASRTTMS